MLLLPVFLITGLFCGCFTFSMHRERRQSICVDAWANMANPCLNNPQKAIYLPHPFDTTKFIQCDMMGRMYVIQCPQGEIYDMTTSSCATGGVATTQSATTHNHVTTATTSATKIQTTTLSQNPCTNANLAKGNIYFPHPQDNNKFIECDLVGNAIVLSCDPGLVWNQQRLSCVFDIQPGGIRTTSITTAAAAITLPPTGSTNNICTTPVLNTDQLFHPHPNPHKFYQCDLWGDAFVNDCPPNLIWNDNTKTCSSPYLSSGVVG